MKKIISIFLCFVLLIMALTGCGSEKKSETNNSSNDTSLVSDASNSENESKPDKSESLLTKSSRPF